MIRHGLGGGGKTCPAGWFGVAGRMVLFIHDLTCWLAAVAALVVLKGAVEVALVRRVIARGRPRRAARVGPQLAPG